MQTYLNLVEGGRPLVEDGTYDCHQAVTDLLGHALDNGGLRTEGVWRLHRAEARRLEESTGYRPPGGWKKFCSLAAGSGVVRATADDFQPDAELSEVAEWGVAGTRRRLVEAFTRTLVPPQAAAGFFVVLGVHPLWGLRLAHRMHGHHAKDLAMSETERSVLDTLEEIVFGALGGIIAALRQLEPTKRYGVEALTGVVGECCAKARRKDNDSRELANTLALLQDDPDWTSFEQDSRAHHRALDFTTEGLIDSVLVPAAALTRFDDGTFCVTEHAFEGILVGHMKEHKQNQWLATLISGSLGHLVA